MQPFGRRGHAHQLVDHGSTDSIRLCIVPPRVLLNSCFIGNRHQRIMRTMKTLALALLILINSGLTCNAATSFTSADNAAVSAAALAIYNKCGTETQIEKAVINTLKKRGRKLTPTQITDIDQRIMSALSSRCDVGFHYVGGCNCEGCPDGQYSVGLGKCCDVGDSYDSGMCNGQSGASLVSPWSSGPGAPGMCFTYTNQAACTLWGCTWDGSQCY